MASFGLFNFWSLGAEFRFFKLFGLSFDFGGATVDVMHINKMLGSPIKTNKDGADIQKINATFKHQEIRAVIYPFMGSFFIGAAIGNRDIAMSADANVDVSGTVGQVSGYLKVKNQYVTPQLGWLAVFDNGFSIGTELGAQLPISKGTGHRSIAILSTGGVPVSAITSSGGYKEVEKRLDDMIHTLQRQVFPFWNIIKIGWLF